MTGNRKPLLSYNDLINKMENTGFSSILLIRWTLKLFFRIVIITIKSPVYRKLFDKTDGKYNIEFATLADLAVIDMLLRYFYLIFVRC